jgi:hypothetical protein
VIGFSALRQEFSKKHGCLIRKINSRFAKLSYFFRVAADVLFLRKFRKIKVIKISCKAMRRHVEEIAQFFFTNRMRLKFTIFAQNICISGYLLDFRTSAGFEHFHLPSPLSPFQNLPYWNCIRDSQQVHVNFENLDCASHATRGWSGL